MRKNLQQARSKSGMTQQELADALGINVRTYQYIEAGIREGSVELWLKLEKLFGESIEYLLQKDAHMNI